MYLFLLYVSHVNTITLFNPLCKYYFALFFKYLQKPPTGFEPACREINHAFFQLKLQGTGSAIVCFYLRLTLGLNALADTPRFSSWAKRIRTDECSSQSAVPYPLAIAHYSVDFLTHPCYSTYKHSCIGCVVFVVMESAESNLRLFHFTNRRIALGNLLPY